MSRVLLPGVLEVFFLLFAAFFVTSLMLKNPSGTQSNVLLNKYENLKVHSVNNERSSLKYFKLLF